MLGAVLEAAGLAGGAVVGPVPAGAGGGRGQVDAAPAPGGQSEVGLGPLCTQATTPLPPGAAGKILAYAEAQIGKPYLWGATGPDAYDCSGLAMMAYRAAGLRGF